MIIVEGADNSGKSTLVKSLSDALKVPSFHPGGPPKSPSERLLRLSEQLMRAHHPVPIIFDRVTCISDPIYRRNIYELIPKTFVEAMIQIPHTFLIYCRPPTNVLAGVLDHEPKSHESVEHLNFVKTNWLSIASDYDTVMSGIPHEVYDFTRDSIEQLINKIKEKLWTQWPKTKPEGI